MKKERKTSRNDTNTCLHYWRVRDIIVNYVFHTNNVKGLKNLIELQKKRTLKNQKTTA